MEKSNRLFEYKGHWLVRRPDTDKLSIAWLPRSESGAGARRIQRVSTGTADLEEARERLMAHVDGLERPALASPSLPRPGWTAQPALLDLLSDYVEKMRDRPSFRNAELPALARWTEFLTKGGIVYLPDLTLDRQEAFVAWRRQMVGAKKGSCSNGTLNRELGVLRAALRQAWKRGRIPYPPHVMTLTNPPPRQRFLSAEEAERLIEACLEPHLRRFVLLALHTLQRPSAILNLRVQQVDLEANRIDFLSPGAEQTRKRRPVVPITTTLRPELERAMDESQCGFVIEWNGEPVGSVKTSFRKAAKRAGLDGVCPYTLRHTGATLLAASGVPMRQIAGFLGHTTDRTTELYAKHAPEFLQDAAAQLDGLFPGRRASRSPAPAPSVERSQTQRVARQRSSLRSTDVDEVWSRRRTSIVTGGWVRRTARAAKAASISCLRTNRLGKRGFEA